MQDQPKSAAEAFNIKEFILKAFSFKYFYIASGIICISVAVLFYKFYPAIYEVNSVIGPTDNSQSSLVGTNDLFNGLGAFAKSRNLEDDINSINSFTLIASTLNRLNLEVGYFQKKNKFLGQTTQIYPNLPFIVSIDKSHIQPINNRFYIYILNESSYRLTCYEKKASLYNYIDNQIISENNVIKIDTICRFNETLKNKYFKFSVSLNKDFYAPTSEGEYLSYFELYHLDELTKDYLKNLKVGPVTSNSSLVNVRIQGKNIPLIINFLNKFLQNFLDDNLSKKNKISVNTVKFIDSQISDISDSLMISESKLKNYRSEHQVTDLSYQGQKALEQMTALETERSNLILQERYYNYILNYFAKNQDIAGLVPPSSANVNDEILNKLIADLFTLNSERSNISSTNNEKNLFIGQIDNKIKLQKQGIFDNVSNSLNTLNLTLNELNYRADKLSKEISTLPRTELNMVSMQRKFNLSDAIYTFLLQKRSEAAITMASNYPDYEILEPAREVTKELIAPKLLKIFALALMLALIIPTIFVVLKEFFNEKITTVSDVEHLLDRSILSIIYTNPYKKEGVVSEYPRSSIAESFRNLRSSLFLKLKSEPMKVILVSSAQPQDGKSFVSFNLSTSIAAVGHKTIVLDCDLRRPTLHDKFKDSNVTGLSNYLTKDLSKEDIIHKTSVENLYFIPAGPLLPNSSELIESGLLDELFNYLKEKYDYIIIDTTPAGLVADAMLMMKYSSLNLLVIRNNYTRKDILTDVISMLKTNMISNFDIVFNDMNINKSRYSSYNSYYKKG